MGKATGGQGMKATAAIVAIAGIGLCLAGQAKARFRIVDPFGRAIPRVQRIVDRSKLPQPRVTVMVWPLSDLGVSDDTEGGDFWGQRPFLIALGSRPSPDEVFHELGHVTDDGWQTAGQRCAFERIFGFSPHGWFFSDGSDAASDNWAQVYAVASTYGAHPRASLARSSTGMPASDWSHSYGWVLGVAARSARVTPMAPVTQNEKYCG